MSQANKSADRNVSRKELAKALSVGDKHVDVLRKQGVLAPVNPGERYPRYNLASSKSAYRAFRKEVERTIDGTDELNASSLRRWRSRVRIAEQKLTKLQSKTMPMLEVKEEWDWARAELTKILSSFPDIAADGLVKIKDPATIADRLDIKVRALLYTCVAALQA
jgi:hypothetical protein